MASPYIERETVILKMARSLEWMTAESLARKPERVASYGMFTDIPRETMCDHDAEAYAREVFRRAHIVKRETEAV